MNDIERDLVENGAYDLTLLPPVPHEDEIVAREWPRMEEGILKRLSDAWHDEAALSADDVLEQVSGRVDDDSPLPDFVARRLPPIVDAIGALLIEVWILDSRYMRVERLAGHSTERGALPRWETVLDQSGLLPPGGSGRSDSTRVDVREYRPVPAEMTLWAPLDARQVVIAMVEGETVLGYVRAIFRNPAGASAARSAELYRLVHVLKHAIVGSEYRRLERARDELANLGNRVADAHTFLGELVEHFLPRVLALHAASIFFVNEAGDGLVLARTTGLDDRNGASTPPVYGFGVGLTGYVWAHRRSLRFPDDLQATPEALLAYDPPPVLKSLSRERLPLNARRQFLAVPLVRERDVVGVLRLGGRTGEWRFSERDEGLANALASQIVQIYSHLRTIAEGLAARTTLIKTMELLPTMQRENDMVRTTLLALTSRQGLAFNRAAYWSFDEDCRSLSPVMVIGAATAEEDQLLRDRVNGALEQLVKNASSAPELFETSLNARFQGLSVVDLDSSEDCLSRVLREPSRNRVAVVELGEQRAGDTNELRAVFGEVEARVVPLWASDSCIGCLYVDRAFDRAPIRRELEELLLAHARHLAGAIKASRESTQRRLAHDFHRRLSAALVAPGDPQSVARGIVSAIREVLGFEKILIYCHDACDGVIRLLGCHGFGQLPSMTFRAGKLVRAIVPKVVVSRRPYFTELSEDDEQLNSEWKTLLDLRGPLLAFPLQLGGLITGVLVINDASVNPATEFVLQPLADMLGVAVRTIAQDERLDAREKMIALLRKIQKDPRAADNEESFASALAAELVEIIPAQLCAVYRPLPSRLLHLPGPMRELTFERRGNTGYPESLKNTPKYPRTGPNTGLTSHVLCGKALNVPQVDADERWEGSEYVALTEILEKKVRAFMGVPLIDSENRVLGAITMTRIRTSADDGLAFQNQELELLKGIAEGISNVLELKDARTALEEHVARIDALSRADDRLVAAAGSAKTVADIKNLAQAVADELRRVCGADLVVVYGPEHLMGHVSPCLSGDFWHRDAVAGPGAQGMPRSGQRVVGEYFEDAAQPYDGQVPDASIVGRERIVSFAHIRVFGTNGDSLICAFVNYRAPHRFPQEERKSIERFAANCGLLIEIASRPRLRVLQGGSSVTASAVGAGLKDDNT